MFIAMNRFKIKKRQRTGVRERLADFVSPISTKYRALSNSIF